MGCGPQLDTSRLGDATGLVELGANWGKLRENGANWGDCECKGAKNLRKVQLQTPSTSHHATPNIFRATPSGFGAKTEVTPIYPNSLLREIGGK